MFCNSCNNNNGTTLASLVDSSTVATSGCYTGFIPVSVNYNVVPGSFVSGTNFTNNNLASANPFSALDKSTERQIFANLKAQAKENIVLLISHRLYLFQQMNQIIRMEDGKTVVGTHEELLVKVPEYKKLFTEEGGAESEDRQK